MKHLKNKLKSRWAENIVGVEKNIFSDKDLYAFVVFFFLPTMSHFLVSLFFIKKKMFIKTTLKRVLPSLKQKRKKSSIYFNYLLYEHKYICRFPFFFIVSVYYDDDMVRRREFFILL